MFRKVDRTIRVPLILESGLWQPIIVAPLAEKVNSDNKLPEPQKRKLVIDPKLDEVEVESIPDAPEDFNWATLGIPRGKGPASLAGFNDTELARGKDQSSDDELPSHFSAPGLDEIPAKPQPVDLSQTSFDYRTHIPNTDDLGMFDRPGDRPVVSGILDKKRVASFGKRLLPALSGSTTSSLQGGTLRQKYSDATRKYMSSEELKEANKIRTSLGKTALANYLKSLNLHERVGSSPSQEQ